MPLIPNHAGKLTHFHNKGFAICLVLKERVFGLNWKLLIQLLCHALKGCFYFPLVNNYKLSACKLDSWSSSVHFHSPKDLPFTIFIALQQVMCLSGDK